MLKEAGYSLILGDTNNRHEEQLRYLSVFRSKQVDGFLLFITPGDDNEAASLVKAKKPVVFVGRNPVDMKADIVSGDNTKGTRLAVQHLISKGHRRIGLVNGERGLSTSTERLNGWKGVCERLNLRRRKN